MLSSEHGTFTSASNAKDASKSKSKSKSKKAAIDSEDEDESDSGSDSDDSLVKALKAKKRAPPAKGGKKKPTMDALFRLNWWRIVLGELLRLGSRFLIAKHANLR